MAAHKGHARVGGRKKGTPNKLTASAKEAFALAFDELGGWKGLAAWGREPKNRGAFYMLYAKLIPIDVTSGGQPIAAPIVTFQSTPDA